MLSEKPHTVILNILPKMQGDSQSRCAESDVLENVLYFITENASVIFLCTQEFISSVSVLHNTPPPLHPHLPQVVLMLSVTLGQNFITRDILIILWLYVVHNGP